MLPADYYRAQDRQAAHQPGRPCGARRAALAGRALRARVLGVECARYRAGAPHPSGDTRGYLIREIPLGEAGPVLKQYVRIAPATRAYFQAQMDSAVEDFAAEADRHPVFELTPVGEDPPLTGVDADKATLPAAALVKGSTAA